MCYNVSQTVTVSLASKLINTPLLSLLPPLIRTVLKKKIHTAWEIIYL